ncbi:MAG TPA: DUF6077 domain-containing protein [Vicinamibacteria bacterium]
MALNEPPRPAEALPDDLPDAARSFAMTVMAAMALATVITHLGQAVGISFRFYAILIAATTVALTAVVAYRERTRIVAALVSSPISAAVLGSLAALTAIATLFAHRPHADDYFYIPNVVYYVAHPDQAMGYINHFILGADAPVSTFYQGTALPFEYSQGAFAYLLGVHVLTVYHVLTPALFGFLLPLVWFYLISRFEFSDRAAIFGAMLIGLSLPLLGEAHCSYGTFGINRLWHGKAVVLALGLPLFAALSVDFLREVSRRHWARLFICATALVGMSPSAIVLLSLLAFLMAAAGAVAFPRDLRERIRVTAVYGVSLCYVAVFAVAFLTKNAGKLGSDSPLNETMPRTFLGHAAFMFSLDSPTSLVLLAMSLAGALLTLRGWSRRFLGAWLLCAGIALLNPLVAPFLIDHVTSPNIYWRLFYLLPFPLAIGLTGAALGARVGVGATTRGNAAAGLLVCLLVGAHWIPGSSSIFRRGTEVRLGVKLRPAARDLAQRVIESTPPGVMLAPWPLGNVISMLGGDHPQVRTKPDGLRLWFSRHELNRRITASDFLKRGESRCQQGDVEAVLALVERYPEIRSVLARGKVARKYDLERVLAAKGFTESHAIVSLVVFAKPPQH